MKHFLSTGTFWTIYLSNTSGSIKIFQTCFDKPYKYCIARNANAETRVRLL